MSHTQRMSFRFCSCFLILLQESWSSIYLAHSIFPWLLVTKGQGCFALLLRKGLTLKPRVTLNNQQPARPCAEPTGGKTLVPACGEQNFTWMMLCFSFPEGWAPLLGWAALELCLFLVYSVGFPTEDSHFPAHQLLYQGCVQLHPMLLLTSLSWFLFSQVPSLPWSPFYFSRVLGVRSKREVCRMCLSACDANFS